MKTVISALALSLGLFAGPLAATPPDFTALVEDAVPAVVNIETVRFGQRPDESGDARQEEMPEFFRRFFDMPNMPRGRPDQRGAGSGFIIESDGLIITNHHVVAEADEVIVRLNDRREFVAEIVGSDEGSDIALLQIDATGLPTLDFGDSDALKPGEWVIAVGSPFNFEQSVTAGIVSAKGRTNAAQQYVPFIQTDVAINRGNSGGPLINMKGEVVGINSWILSSSGGNIGLSFSIPIEVARDTVHQIQEYGSVSRGYLGVGIEVVDRQKADSLGLSRPRGALVNRVESGSAADEAGVEVGDVILDFKGKEIDMFSDLPPIVGSTRPGTEVEMQVWRWGERLTLDAEVGELPTDGPDESGDRPSQAEPSNALGLTVEPLTDALRRRIGDVDGGGVVVSSVESDAAYRAGVRPGQVIQMINNQRVEDMSDFEQLVASIESGRSVALLIWQGGNTTFLAYTPEPES